MPIIGDGKKIIKFIDNHSLFFLWSSILIYIVFFSAFCLWKLDNFLYNAIDLSIFNQVFFNTLHGRWFDMTVNINNYLGDHFTPIIILLLPFYALKPGPEILLIMQTVFLALCAWPLYKISQLVLANKYLSLGVATLWLLNPFVHSANLFEFHLLPLVAFFLLWTFYWYQKNNFKFFLLFFFLTLMVREDSSLLLLGFVPLALLGSKSLRWKITPLVLGLVYFFLSLKIIGLFSPIGSSKFFIYYGWLGGHDLLSIFWSWLIHPLQLLAHIFSIKNISAPIFLTLPLLGIPLLRPKYFWLAIFPFLQIILSFSGFANYLYFMQYVLFFMPGVFIALIFGVKKIQERKVFWSSKFIYQQLKFFQVLLLFAAIYFLIFLSPATQFFSQSAKNYYRAEFKAIIDKFNQTDKLIASDIFLPSLSSRTVLYPAEYTYQRQSQFGYTEFIPPPVDYILIDYQSFLTNLVEIEDLPYLRISPDQLTQQWREWLGKYHLISAEDNLLLWTSSDNSRTVELPLIDLVALPATSTVNFILDSQVEEKSDQKNLQLTLQNVLDDDRNYLIRFYRPTGWVDLPLFYGFWTPTNWPTDQALAIHYYLRSDITHYQIFSWQGINKLGRLGQVVSDFQVTPITDIIAL